ncbi:hypothetical protein DYB32_010939 [Aphanomyces invadans]|uniref:Uncharacterized protein n=1 Tax=Aphanomyces invadans TaxID=157072 RepID=A0A3R6VNB9_9STRA|nr:hypothetical protein DYB32_010939 [Aphanomyces invadans]
MPPSHADFISKNRLARAIILAGLDNHHVRMVSKQPTAASLMKLLSERYGIMSFMGESYLFQNLLEIRIRHNESARAYCDRFKIHLDGVLDDGMTIDDKLQVHTFLNSLDERFESFINFQTHVFQHGEVIDGTTLHKLFIALIQKEIRSSYGSSDAALTTTSRRNQRSCSHHGNHDAAIVCSYCNIRNHTEDVCRRKRADQQHSNSGQRRVPNNTAPPADSAAPASSERPRGPSSQASSGPNCRRHGQSTANHVSMLANVSHFTLRSTS